MRFTIALGLLALWGQVAYANPSVRERVYARSLARHLQLDDARPESIRTSAARGVKVSFEGLQVRRLRFRTGAAALEYARGIDGGAVEVRGRQVVHLEGRRLADSGFAERAMTEAWSILPAPPAEKRTMVRVAEREARAGERSARHQPRGAPESGPDRGEVRSPQPRRSRKVKRQQRLDLSGSWDTAGGKVVIGSPKRAARSDEYSITFPTGGETVTLTGEFDGQRLVIEREREDEEDASTKRRTRKPRLPQGGTYRGARGALAGGKPGTGGNASREPRARDENKRNKRNKREKKPRRGTYTFHVTPISPQLNQLAFMANGTVDPKGPLPVQVFARQVSRAQLTISSSRSDASAAPDTAMTRTGTITLWAHVSPNVEGTFQWSTTSRGLELMDDERRAMVTGLAVGSHTLRCTFRPASTGEAITKDIQVKVVSVTFSAARTQRYGFDDMGGTGDRPHVSVRKNDHTTVRVTIRGGVDASRIQFKSESTSVATITPPSSGTSFDLRIDAKRVDKGKARVNARLLRADGTPGLLAGSLEVNVYKQQRYSAKVFRVHDSTSAGTRLSLNLNVGNARRTINGWYKPAVAWMLLTGGDLKDIRYDLNNNGRLDLDPGGTSDEEKAITNALGGRGQKVIVVKDASWVFFLDEAAAVGSTTLKLKSSYSGNVNNIRVGDDFELGSGATKETVVVKAKDGTTLTLETGLRFAHPTSDGLEFPLSGLSGNPLWAEENGKDVAKLTQTIGHELGHQLLTWKDLDATKNLMHFSSGREDTQLRFMQLPKHYHAGENENQWEKVER